MFVFLPGTIKSIGFWILVAGLFGDILVLFIPASKRKLEKSLAVSFILVIIAGVAIEKVGDNLIEDRNGPRAPKINSQQLTSLLKPYAGQEFTILPYTAETEVTKLNNLLFSSLKDAGWVYRDHDIGDMLIGTMVAVEIVIDNKADERTGAAARALGKFLNDAWVATVVAPREAQHQNTIAIHIGTRIKLD